MTTAVGEHPRTAGPVTRPAGRGDACCTTARAATRTRQRLVVLALLVVVVGVILALGRATPSAAGAGIADEVAEGTATEEVLVVGPGETIWDLVRPHTPAGVSPAVYAAHVAEANDLDPLRVAPGTVVRLP